MIGKLISHYKIIERLGVGGMGVVYKAEDTKLKRTVALKFLPHDLFRDPDSKKRFVHEAQAASALQHNNICTIYDIDETDDGQMFLCMEYYFRGSTEDYENAIKLYKKSLETDPTFASAYAGLSDVYQTRTFVIASWYDSAMTMAQKAIALDVNCMEAYCSLGKLYSDGLSRFLSIPKAVKAYNKALELNPSSYRAHYLMGDLKLQTENYDEAIYYTREAIKLNPMSEHAYRNMGRIYFGLNNFDSAKQYYDKALEIAPDNIAIIGNLASLYRRQKKYDQTIESLKKILKIDPHNQWTYYFMGGIYKRQGKFEDAIVYLEKAIQLGPSHRWNYLSLAMVYVEQDKYDNAITIYQKTQSTFPNCLFTALNYSFVLVRMGKLDQAKSMVEKLLNDPNVEFMNCKAGMIPITRFYLGTISGKDAESEVESEIIQVRSKLGFKYCFVQPYYYLSTVSLP